MGPRPRRGDYPFPIVPSMSLNRLARPALVVVASLILGACGAVTPSSAAVVDDTEISQDDLLDEARRISENELLRQQQESQGVSVAGDTEGSYDAAFVANLLQFRIYLTLAERELERRDVTIGQDDLAAARRALEQQPGGAEALADLPAEVVEDQLRQNAVISVLGQELVEADPEALYEEDPGQFDELCVSHIFVGTDQRTPAEAEARAAELAQRLDQGADYATLAAEESDDPASAAEGGSLGCGGRGRFIPEFEEAAFALEEGEISDPVQTQVGYHIIRVDERNPRTFEEAADEIQASMQAEVGTAIQQFLADASAEAEVDVNPRFGTWTVPEGQRGVVEPPSGPAAPASGDEPLGEPVPVPVPEP